MQLALNSLQSESMQLQVLIPYVVLCGVAAAFGPGALAESVEFSGYTWQVRSDTGGPGPNVWDPRNVSVDLEGRLHLRIENREGQWSCAEVFIDQNLGFGRYQFEVIGRPDLLDDNVVLGLFNYTRPELGPDGTNEIDIEFATWGGQQTELGNWTIYPFKKGPKPPTRQFPIHLDGDLSTHRFTWSPRQIFYQSLYGHQLGNENEFARWRFIPMAYRKRIPQKPIPVHMNLWLFEGQPPTDSQPVEIVISAFRFTPRVR